MMATFFKKKNKQKWQFFSRDTIFSGSFTKEAKYHTIENIVRMLSCVFIIIGARNFYLFLIIGIVLAGFVIKPIFNSKKYEITIW